MASPSSTDGRPSAPPDPTPASAPASTSASSSTLTPAPTSAFSPASALAASRSTSSTMPPPPAELQHFSDRFLPPHVDPSHVISSAAPSSLPIELPALRDNHDEHDHDHAHGAYGDAAATPLDPPPSPEAVHAARLQSLGTFERWTLRASESQFNALAGAVGGFTAGIVTCPLDVIKTKLQAQGGFVNRQQQTAQTASTPPAPSSNSIARTAQAAAAAGGSNARLYNGLGGTASVIWRDEGIRGLYRGLGPIIMGYLPTWAVWFTVYNKSKLYLGERYHNTFVINFWSSVIAGASSTIVTNPIWVIKTRLMSQMPAAAATAAAAASPNASPNALPHPGGRAALSTPWHYTSTIDAARKMYAHEGLLSFYSGLTPALLGLTHVAVQFPAYEYFKTTFTGRGMGESGGASDGSEPTHWLGVLSATILSKVLASSLTYPHEVIRTRLQTQRRRPAAEAAAATRYRGIVTTFQTILREEGWRAFYAGMGTNMMRAVPAATVTMLTYEYMMRELKRTRHEARLHLEQ